MNTSFYNGIIGIKSHQTGIDIIADNIDNINSTAYKEVQPEFSTIFSTTLNDGYSPSVFSGIGLGSKVDSTSTNLSQGSLLSTDNNFDVAIEGEGWFGVKGKNNQTYFTRDGSFSKDDNGDLVNAMGYYLLGTPAGNISPTTLPQSKLDSFGKKYTNGNISEITPFVASPNDTITLSDPLNQDKINLPDLLYLPPEPTTHIKYKANLDPTIKTQIDQTTGNLVEIPNVEHFTTPLISPDGSKDILDMTFTKRVPQQPNGTVWDATLQIHQYYEKYDPSKTYDPAQYKIYQNEGKVYKIVDTQTGVLSFNSSGALLSNTLPALSNSGTPLEVNLGTPLNASQPGSGYDGLISLKGESFANSVQADGHIEGFLTNYGINENGEVIAEFTNGRSIPVAKIGVYHFQNDQGLERVSGSLFQESSNSGKAIFYKDVNGNFINNSKITSHKLEQSNVSLANALTELIVMQKAFDANAKSITTSDQMIQKAINMKK